MSFSEFVCRDLKHRSLVEPSLTPFPEPYVPTQAIGPEHSSVAGWVASNCVRNCKLF